MKKLFSSIIISLALAGCTPMQAGMSEGAHADMSSGAHVAMSEGMKEGCKCCKGMMQGGDSAKHDMQCCCKGMKMGMGKDASAYPMCDKMKNKSSSKAKMPVKPTALKSTGEAEHFHN